MTYSNPLGILLFTDSDVFAGTERHILDLAIGLRAEGAEVTVACPSPAKLEALLDHHGIRHIVVQKGGAWDRAAIRILRGLLRSSKADIIHAHNGRTTLSAALAVRSAGRGRCVSTQHFIHPNHTTHRGIKRLISSATHLWVNNRIHAHVAISQAVLAAAVARGEMAAVNIHRVHNGISDPARGDLRPASQLRAALDIPSDAPLIVCTARLEVEKGIEHLARAMEIVRRADPRAVCVIAGEGSLRPDLERLIRDLGLLDSVRMPGFLADPLSLVNAADICVLPSLAEPFGLAILEAMALGKPMVATRAGGPVEIVVENETGLLVEPANAESLAAALARLMGNPTERSAMGLAGRARYESRFTETQMAREMMKVYQSTLA